MGIDKTIKPIMYIYKNYEYFSLNNKIKKPKDNNKVGIQKWSTTKLVTAYAVLKCLVKNATRRLQKSIVNV